MQSNRILFYNRLATTVNNGIPVVRFLESSMPLGLRGPCRRMRQDILNGQSLTQAMRHESCFSKLEIALIFVGEQTGTLPRIAHALEAFATRSKAFKAVLLSKSVYPILLYLVVGPMIRFINMILQSVASKTAVDPLSDEGLLTLFFFALRWWCYPLILFFIAKYFSSKIIRLSILGAVVDVLPLFGTLQHRINMSIFWNTMSICLDAGINYPTSLHLSADACPSEFYGKNYHKAAELMEKQQYRFSQALEAVQNRRDARKQYTSSISAAEFAGTVADEAAHISQLADEDAQTLLERLGTLLPFLVYVGMTLYIAFQVVSLGTLVLGGALNSSLEASEF